MIKNIFLNLENSKKKNINLIIDAKNKILGRFINKIIFILKNNIKITILIINIADIKISGLKSNRYFYFSTQHIGSFYKETLKNFFDKAPSKVFEFAIHGALSKNKENKQLLKNVHFLNTINSFII